MSSLEYFDRFEELAQGIVERTFGNIFGSSSLVGQIIFKLTQAIEDGQIEGRAANFYQLSLCSEDYKFLQNNYPGLRHLLIEYIEERTRQTNLNLASSVVLEMLIDDSLAKNKVLVKWDYDIKEEEPTIQISTYKGNAVDSQLKNIGAFLIIDGTKHYPIKKPILSLGRRADSDIVLDINTVSRRHAQIQWRNGSFFVYDLGSRAGTAVNGLLVQDSILSNGDVISLGPVSIIFGVSNEEDPYSQNSADNDEQQHTLSLDS